MELKQVEFFESYGLNKYSKEEDLIDLVRMLSKENKTQLAILIKNMLTLRILSIAERENGLKKRPDMMGVPLMSVFIKKTFLKTMKIVSLETNILFPKAHISGLSCLVIITSTVAWCLFLSFYLYQHIELLFLGLEAVIFPFCLIVIGAPLLLLHFLFPSFIAVGDIKDVKSFDDFISATFDINFKYFREENYKNTIRELLVIQNEAI